MTYCQKIHMQSNFIANCASLVSANDVMNVFGWLQQHNNIGNSGATTRDAQYSTHTSKHLQQWWTSLPYYYKII